MRLLKTLTMVATILATSFPVPASAQSAADLSLSIAGHPDPVVNSQTVTWTITVRNLGPDQATGVLLEASYGSDAFPVSATSTQGTCAPSGGEGIVDFTLGKINPGGEVTATLVMQAFVGDGGLISLRASSNSSDPNLSNNSAEGRVEVLPGPRTDELGGTFCPPSGGVATGGGGTAAGATGGLAAFALLAMAGLLAAAILRVRW